MSRKFFIGIVALMITAFLVVPSMAKNPKGEVVAKGPKDKVVEKGPSGQAGKSNIAHLYLYEKTSEGTVEGEDWPIVEGGMWGKMKYNLSGFTFDFVFNGHKLPIGVEYTLIYYPDPWPAEGLICLGSGVVIESEDGSGNIHIKNSVDTGNLPIESDDNFSEGAKIFLVPTEHVDCENQKMVGWAEDANLYEGALITFDYPDDE